MLAPANRAGGAGGGMRLADPDQEAWWRTTKALAVAALGGAALISFLVFVFSRLAGIDLFALPLDYLLPAAVMPLVLLAVIFWYERRQAEVDRQHQMTED